MNEWIPILVAMLAFCSMAGITFVAGQYYLRAVSSQPANASSARSAAATNGSNRAPLQASSPDTLMRSDLESMPLNAVNFD